MLTIKQALQELPNTTGCVVVLSGGLDSTITMRLAVQKYGAENVSAITFDYGQKQALEIERAKASTRLLGVRHKIVDASFLGDISQGFSANVDKSIAMPTIQEVLGDPSPKTYVPNRNMILFSIVAAYAETQNVDTIICGLQIHDEYSYWDTTKAFVDNMNEVFSLNRKMKIKLIAPFSALSKTEELKLLYEIDGNLDLTESTLTCYNPDERGRACGRCPSCSERVKAFIQVGVEDPNEYSINIPWKDLFAEVYQ